MIRAKIFVLILTMTAVACANATEEKAKPVETKENPVVLTPVEKAPIPKPTKVAAVPSDDEKAPEKFAVKFVTTQGDIVIDVEREWTPRGADRFYTLVKSGYYTDVAFFRVLEGFMAQTGISGDPQVNAKWRVKRIKDDAPKKSNSQGMVTFAMGGPNSRTTQFFINFGDNLRLDSMGFAPFGKVREMTTVNKLYSGYGEGAPRGKGPSQGRLQREGNTYLKAEFPQFDYIKSAAILAE
jgi:cyclophilin family peptidyl-prolyl cis-trans isomerase